MREDEMHKRQIAHAQPELIAVGQGGRDGMPVPPEVDVLVVGLGPVGAAIANLLGRYGVNVLVIDKATEIFADPRAIVLDHDALRILQAVGVEDGDLDKVAVPYVRYLSPYFGEFGRVNTLGSIDCHPKLVTFFQPQLERVLRDRLAQYPNVRVVLGATLTTFQDGADAVTAEIEVGGRTVTVRSKYLVGADGACSVVRQLVGESFDGHTYPEDWLVVDARRKNHSIDHVEFICDSRRPAPHMAAPNTWERWEFKLRPGETRADFEDPAKVYQLLARWGTPDDMSIERKAIYRFHARVAKRFVKGRVILAGDAAHITPPFAGQGLVAGLRDAANLSWKLAWIVSGRASAGILESYNQERRPHADKVVKAAQFLGTLIMPRNAAKAVLIHGAMKLARLFRPLRAHLEELGFMPPSQFPEGLFLKGTPGSRLIDGGKLPQALVRGSDGAVRLSDDVLGASLTLIGFGKHPRSALEPAVLRDFAAAGGTLAQITHRAQKLYLDGPDHWEDVNGVFLPGVASFGWAAIVRPDRTILHSGPIEQVNELVRESLRLLGRPAFRLAEAVAEPEPSRTAA